LSFDSRAGNIERTRRSTISEFRAAKTWVARSVGTGGLGTNPTNPWCQRPRRPPLHYKNADTAHDSTNFHLDEKRYTKL
jgi:hypothetical protein